MIDYKLPGQAKLLKGCRGRRGSPDASVGAVAQRSPQAPELVLMDALVMRAPREIRNKEERDANSLNL